MVILGKMREREREKAIDRKESREARQTLEMTH